MQNKFIVNHNERELGPLNESQIKKMLASNQLFPTDYFFDEEKKDWILLSERFEAVMNPPAVEVKPKAPQSNLSSFPPGPSNTDFEPAMKVEHEKPVAQAAPKPAPVVTTVQAPTPAPIPTPVQESAHAGPGKVQFADGVGTISLKQLKAGQIQLKLKTASGLDLPENLVLTIQAGPASQIKITAPHEARAGDDVMVELHALDAFENLASDFKESMELIFSGLKSQTGAVQFKDGIAKVAFKPTRAEVGSLQIKKNGKSPIALPSAHQLTIYPNVPVRLVAEAPQDVRAGEEIKVKVTALDAYDNVVTDFKGEVELAVESEVVKKAG